jgi:DNA-binding FrmR family transcriptional regulator
LFIFSTQEKKLKKDLIVRLRKVEGQIKGLQKMLEEDKDCEQIFTQISASRAALNRINSIIIENYTKQCLVKAQKEECCEEVINNLTSILIKFCK